MVQGRSRTYFQGHHPGCIFLREGKSIRRQDFAAADLRSLASPLAAPARRTRELVAGLRCFQEGIQARCDPRLNEVMLPSLHMHTCMGTVIIDDN